MISFIIGFVAAVIIMAALKPRFDKDPVLNVFYLEYGAAKKRVNLF